MARNPNNPRGPYAGDKTRIIGIRFSPSEYELLEAQCKRLGLTKTQYIRLCIDELIKGCERKSKDPDPDL